LANTGFLIIYNHIGLRAYRMTLKSVIWNLAKWNSWNETKHAELCNFCMLPRHAGLSASAGLSCTLGWAALRCWRLVCR